MTELVIPAGNNKMMVGVITERVFPGEQAKLATCTFQMTLSDSSGALLAWKALDYDLMVSPTERAIGIKVGSGGTLVPPAPGEYLPKAQLTTPDGQLATIDFDFNADRVMVK